MRPCSRICPGRWPTSRPTSTCRRSSTREPPRTSGCSVTATRWSPAMGSWVAAGAYGRRPGVSLPREARASSAARIPLRAGSRATATVGREAAAWRAVADTSGAGAHPGVWELAWPTIVSNLLFSASGFIDIKIVGSLGASAVAAITTGTRIFFTAQAVLMAILAGTTALVARAWGAGHRDEAAQIAELSLWLCLVVSALLTLGGTLGADALAGLFRLEPQTVALAATFTRWLSVFYTAFAVIMALSTALRAAGDVVTPLWIGALGNVVSVFFTYSLVHGAFGLPALGVAGAAIGNGTGF